jgi:hypothetical protein
MYRIPPSVLRANLEAEEVLLNTDTGQYHVLNETGRTVASLLETGGTADEAATALATRTGTPIDQVRGDVETFVQALLDRGLLSAP